MYCSNEIDSQKHNLKWRKFYEKTNGIRTNDYYDVFANNKILKSEETIFTSDIISFKNIEKKIDENSDSINALIKNNKNNCYEMYYKLNGNLLRILVIETSTDPLFFNAVTGEEIPFNIMFGVE